MKENKDSKKTKAAKTVKRARVVKHCLACDVPLRRVIHVPICVPNKLDNTLRGRCRRCAVDLFIEMQEERSKLEEAHPALKGCGSRPHTDRAAVIDMLERYWEED